MDSYEATKVVFSRIQTLDPENASKIMGYLLLQDQSEKEMIRLAFGPETHLHNLILKAKTHLGLSPTNPTNPISRPNVSLSSLSSSSSSSSSRIANNGGFDITNPSSPSSNNNPWPYNKFSTPSLSYANVVKETSNSGSGSSLSSAFQYNSSDLIDEYQLQDHLSFLNDSKADDLFDPRLELAYTDSPLQRQSYLSNPGICFGSSEDASSGGLGWKPCLYFARGFCKNGSSCRFLHGDSGDSAAAIVGSPSKLNEFEQCQELLRSKAAHQQKLAAGSQFMAGASFPYNKYMNFLMQQQNDTQRSAAAALMMGDELHKFGQCRAERSDFSSIGLGGMVNPGSRQIYLTFPADSIFREEDVSNYFSNYGPVQDVRIPYQQKRMFGFVTFLYPETVKIILAKGNPHFVCDSRVLVKPYKEKGKIPDKKQQQQQLERGEYLACSSPTRLDSRESFDLQLGTRMFYNTQEMLLRRKLEEHADLQQAIELQGRRLMNLQFLDLKNHRYHPNQYHHNLSVDSPIPSPTLTHGPNNQTLILPPADVINQQVSAGNNGKPDSAVSHTTAADADQQLQSEVNPGYTNGIVNSSGKEDKSNPEESDLHECLEHSLPDSLFACPKKSDGDHLTPFSTASSEEPNESTSNASSPSNNSPLMPTTSPLSMASLKNVFSKSSGFLLGMECS